ncbi:MAG: A24 family peptidase [Planctomycetaceae bacterium]|jgi:Flp pilus assembly protein protease CpaA|nr:A24 family peptidase [Planctomycetaceae bacterium]
MFARYLLSFILLLVFGLLWALVFSDRFSNQNGMMVGFICFAVCAISTVTDLRSRTIYNIITYPAFVLIALLTILSAFCPNSIATVLPWKNSLIGFTGCIFVTGIPYALGQGGGGDVKFAAVLGLAFGFTGFVGLLFGFVIAALCCLPIWIGQKIFKPSEKKITAIPMAGFFTVGLLVAIFLEL